MTTDIHQLELTERHEIVCTSSGGKCERANTVVCDFCPWCTTLVVSLTTSSLEN